MNSLAVTYAQRTGSPLMQPCTIMVSCLSSGLLLHLLQRRRWAGWRSNLQRDYHTKWCKLDSERQTSYDITYMWNLKKKKRIKMNLFAEQKQTHGFWKQTYGYQRGMVRVRGVVQRDGLGVFDWPCAHCSMWNDWPTGNCRMAQGKLPNILSMWKRIWKLSQHCKSTILQ